MEDRDYILFEDYLSDSLNERGQKEFEERLSKDEDFREAFKLYKSTSNFLSDKFSNDEERQAFKENLTKISNSYSESTKLAIKKSSYFQPWKLAIAASLLVIFGIFYSQWFSTPTYQDFADYPQISLTQRGVSNTLKTKAETSFNAQNYSEAISFFKTILEDEPENSEIQLYLAIAYVENDNFAKADSIFKNLLNTSSVYLNQVRWYAALSQLKQKDYVKTKNLLQLIPRDAEEYEKAQKLLGDL